MSEPVVSAAWVAANRDSVRLVDVREAWEYDGIGHLPGAVTVPFDSFRAAEHAATGGGPGDVASAGEGDASTGGGRKGMLPDPADFAALMAEAGVARDDDVVAYDDHHGVFAARLLVTLELFGHDPGRLHLLDGDFSAWQRRYETTTGEPAVEPTTYETGEPVDSPLVDADDVAAAVDDPAVVLVDTREDWEYVEGHIPGAVQLDWRELVDDDSRGLRPREEIAAILRDRGIAPDRRVLLYCNTARRISHTYTVLRHLGYDDLGFYEGSLTEWEAAGRPVETG
jgi:thiosulfate/3-mercaptopyruvate sulfurtransferase